LNPKKTFYGLKKEVGSFEARSNDVSFGQEHRFIEDSSSSCQARGRHNGGRTTEDPAEVQPGQGQELPGEARELVQNIEDRLGPDSAPLTQIEIDPLDRLVAGDVVEEVQEAASILLARLGKFSPGFMRSSKARTKHGQGLKKLFVVRSWMDLLIANQVGQLTTQSYEALFNHRTQLKRRLIAS